MHNTSMKKLITMGKQIAIGYFNRGFTQYLSKKYEEARKNITIAINIECQQQKEHYKTKIGYKFRPINLDTINMLQRHEIYFSDVPSLNDPFECPLLNVEKDFEKEVLQDEYTPYILSLVAPEGEVLEDKPNEIINNTLLFSHYADSHRGICIEYEITKKLLEQGKILHTNVLYGDDTQNNIKSLLSFSNGAGMQFSNNTQANSKGHLLDKTGNIDITHLFAIKEERWEYEHEQRFILFGKRQEYEKGTYMKGVRITKIIFGLKTSEDDKQIIYELLQSNKGIRFFNTKSGSHDAYFSLRFEKYQYKPR